MARIPRISAESPSGMNAMACRSPPPPVFAVIGVGAWEQHRRQVEGEKAKQELIYALTVASESLQITKHVGHEVERQMKWVIGLALAAVASGQQLDLSALDKLASRAKSSVNVTLDEDKLKFAIGVSVQRRQNQAVAKTIVSGLKAINVRVFEFDIPGQLRACRRGRDPKATAVPGWSKMVDVKDGDETAEIYMFAKGKDLGGLAIIAGEKRELTVVNIVGPIDLKTLGSLAGKFGIPKDIIGGVISTPKQVAPRRQIPGAPEDKTTQAGRLSSQTGSGLAAMESPRTSILFRSAVPTPKASASFNVLSQSLNGAVALRRQRIVAHHGRRHRIGGHAIRAQQQHAGTDKAQSRIQGPSPPATVSTPSINAMSIGRADTSSAVMRGMRYPGSRGEFGSNSGRALSRAAASRSGRHPRGPCVGVSLGSSTPASSP